MFEVGFVCIGDVGRKDSNRSSQTQFVSGGAFSLSSTRMDGLVVYRQFASGIWWIRTHLGSSHLYKYLEHQHCRLFLSRLGCDSSSFDFFKSGIVLASFVGFVSRGSAFYVCQLFGIGRLLARFSYEIN